MRKQIQVTIDNIVIKGNVKRGILNSTMVHIREPELYSCIAFCDSESNKTGQAEDLLKLLYYSINGINIILQRDAKLRTHLIVMLHHPNSRTKKFANCLPIVKRIFDNGVTPIEEARQLYSAIKGEYLYWQYERVRKFNEFFKENIGEGWEFYSIPNRINQQLRKT